MKTWEEGEGDDESKVKRTRMKILVVGRKASLGLLALE